MQTQFGQVTGPHVEIQVVIRGQATKDVDATFRTELDVGFCSVLAGTRAGGVLVYLVFESLVAKRIRLELRLLAADESKKIRRFNPHVSILRTNR